MSTSVSSWLRSRFPFAEIRPDGEAEIDCPFCRKPKKAWFNTRRGRGMCFACGTRFATTRLVAAVECLNYEAAAAMVRGFDPVAESPRLSELLRGTVAAPGIDWPGDTAPILGMGTELGRLALAFCHSRGLTDEDVAYWGLRVCWGAQARYRIIVPYFDAASNLIYWAARRIDSLTSANPKILYPQGGERPLFGLAEASSFDHVVLVEGQIDAIHVGPQAVALGGSSISNTQMAQLRRAGFQRVTTMLDADDAGRLATPRLLAKLVRHDWVVDVASVPVGCKDPGDAARDQIWYGVQRAKRVAWRDLACADLQVGG